MPKIDFKAIIEDAGIPTEEQALRDQFQQIMSADELGLQISNDSLYSPFWRIMSAFCIKPVLWFLNFIIDQFMPGAFLLTAPGVFLDAIGEGYGLPRKAAQHAQGYIEFTRSDSQSALTIPAQTIIESPEINGKVYRLQTDSAVTLAIGIDSIAIALSAAEPGSGYNLSSGYYTRLLVPINGLSVNNTQDWLVAPGSEVESDDDYRERIRNQFATVGDYHTDAIYKSMLSQWSGVAIDAIYFEHEAPRGPGTANAYVLFDFQTPATTYITEMNDYIMAQGNHGHGDDLRVLEMPTQDYPMGNVEVYVSPFMSSAQREVVKDAVKEYIRCAFRENNEFQLSKVKPFSQFSFSRLGQEIHDINSEVYSIDFNKDDIITALWVPVITTLAVTIKDAQDV